jgi:hypothetical protein
MRTPSPVQPVPGQHRYDQFQRDRCHPRRPLIGQHKRRPIIALFRHGRQTRSQNEGDRFGSIGDNLRLRPSKVNDSDERLPEGTVPHEGGIWRF